MLTPTEKWLLIGGFWVVGIGLWGYSIVRVLDMVRELRDEWRR
jgi:hypothetical protein